MNAVKEICGIVDGSLRSEHLPVGNVCNSQNDHPSSAVRPNSVEVDEVSQTTGSSSYTEVTEKQYCLWCRGSGVIRVGLHCGPCGGKGWTRGAQ